MEMKIIGEDTKDFLEHNKLIFEYVKLLDRDFTELGIDNNNVVLTQVELQKNPDYVAPCLCFYFGNIPNGMRQAKVASIFNNHAEILEKLNIIMHFATISTDMIKELGDNPSMKARFDMFESTII